MIKKLILRWLGLADHEGRLKDVERHFVTKRGTQGEALETLADVPLAERNFKPRMKGLTQMQRKTLLEATDGFSRQAVGERLPSTS